jgi:hypothetical protein
MGPIATPSLFRLRASAREPQSTTTGLSHASTVVMDLRLAAFSRAQE